MAQEASGPEVVPLAEAGMDRREFMRQTLLAGLALLAAPTVLSGLVGCGSGAPCHGGGGNTLGEVVNQVRNAATALREEVFANRMPSLADLQRWLAEMNRLFSQLHSAVAGASGAALREQVHPNCTEIADRLYDEWHESLEFSGAAPVFTQEGFRAAIGRARGILAGLEASEARATGLFIEALCVGHGGLDNDTILLMARLAAARDTEGWAGTVFEAFHPVRATEISAAGVPDFAPSVWYFLAICLFWGMESEVRREYGIVVPTLWVLEMLIAYLHALLLSFF